MPLLHEGKAVNPALAYRMIGTIVICHILYTVCKCLMLLVNLVVAYQTCCTHNFNVNHFFTEAVSAAMNSAVCKKKLSSQSRIANEHVLTPKFNGQYSRTIWLIWYQNCKPFLLLKMHHKMMDMVLAQTVNSNYVDFLPMQLCLTCTKPFKT